MYIFISFGDISNSFIENEEKRLDILKEKWKWFEADVTRKIKFQKKTKMS